VAVSLSAVLPIQIVPPGQVTETSFSPALHKSSHLVSHAASLRACKPALPAGPGGPSGPAGPAGPTPPRLQPDRAGRQRQRRRPGPFLLAVQVVQRVLAVPPRRRRPAVQADRPLLVGLGLLRNMLKVTKLRQAQWQQRMRACNPPFSLTTLSLPRVRRARQPDTLPNGDGQADRSAPRSRSRTPTVCSSAPGISARIRSSARDRVRRVAPSR
jgi:hypothetical protein